MASATKERVNSALPYARQLLEDEYVQEQLLGAAGSAWLTAKLQKQQSAAGPAAPTSGSAATPAA